MPVQGGLHSTSHFRLNSSRKDVHDVRKPGLPLESYAGHSSLACVNWLAAPASEEPAAWSSWGHRLRGEGRPSRKPRVRTGLGLYDRPETGAPGGCPGNSGLWSLELVLARGRGTGRGCTAPSPWPDQLCSRLGALSTCLRRLGKGSRKGWGGEVSWAQSVGEEEGLPMLRCPPPLCWF